MWTFVTLAVGVLLIVAFALWEKRIEDDNPLVPPHLFSHPAFTGGTILALVYFAAFTQHLLHHLAAVAGGAGAHRAGVRAGGGAVRHRVDHRGVAEQPALPAAGPHRARRRHRHGRRRAGLALAGAPQRARGGPHALGAARPLLIGGHRQRPVHRAERAVHRRDRRPLGGRRGQRGDRRDAARRVGHRHRRDRQRPVRHPAHHQQRPGADRAGVHRRRRARHGGERRAGRRRLRAGVRASRARSTRTAGRRPRSESSPNRRRDATWRPRRRSALGAMAIALDVPRLYSATDDHLPEAGTTVWAVAHPIGEAPTARTPAGCW